MHSFISCHLHVVFSTKERRGLITPDLQQRLWPYLGGIARKNKMKALRVGGVEDHVHLLLSLPSTLAISKAVQLLKGNSSKWIHETFPNQREFSWQEGTEHSASGFRAWMTQSNTSSPSRSIYCYRAAKARIVKERAEIMRATPWELTDHFAA